MHQVRDVGDRLQGDLGAVERAAAGRAAPGATTCAALLALAFPGASSGLAAAGFVENVLDFVASELRASLLARLSRMGGGPPPLRSTDDVEAVVRLRRLRWCSGPCVEDFVENRDQDVQCRPDSPTPDNDGDGGGRRSESPDGSTAFWCRAPETCHRCCRSGSRPAR